jgi:hypothetical protein
VAVVSGVEVIDGGWLVGGGVLTVTSEALLGEEAAGVGHADDDRNGRRPGRVWASRRSGRWWR